MASDATVAIFIGVILFLVPSDIPGLTQDPGKNLDWAGRGLWAAPAFQHGMFLQPHLTGIVKAQRDWDDLSRGQGLRDKVRVLQN